MKNDVVENIRLEMKNHKSSVKVAARKGDTKTHTWHITLADSGRLLSLENALFVEIIIEKPDGKSCYNNCVVYGDEIQYTITSQTINVEGTCKCHLEITFNDGAVIYSPEFTLVVYDPKRNISVVKSENEYKALAQQTMIAKKHAEAAADSANSIGKAEEKSLAYAQRAEAAEKNAKNHADRAEDAKEDVAYNAERVIDAAEKVYTSGLETQGYANVAGNAAAVALEAEKNAGISAENAAGNAVLAEKLAGSAQNALNETEKCAENAANSESNAKSYAEQAEKISDEWEGSVALLKEQNQIAYEHVPDTTNPHKTTAEQLGLGKVNNTSDTDKPVSTAQRAAIDTVQSNLNAHENDSANPHKTTAAQLGLEKVDNTPDISKPVSTPQQAAIDAIYANLIAYIDREIANLINGAPSTLNTLGEIATAMETNADVVETLEDAVGSKAKQEELDSHTDNTAIHTTVTEKSDWNKAYEHSKTKHSIEQGGTGATTAKGADYNIHGGMTEETSAIDDDSKFAFLFKTPSATTGAMYFRKASYLWNYIQDKISSILGLTGSDYSGNAATVTKWKNARNINGMSVQGDTNRVNYGTCSTAAATAAKVVSCSGFSLITGAEITVKFTVTNTAASPTLNVNNTGAKAIYYRGSAISAGYLAANRTYTFRYNGTQYDLVGDINTDTNTTYSNATTGASGLMSSTDKTKLNGIEEGAQVNDVTGIKGNAETSYRTGDVNITPENIGLGKVNNTADSEKSVKYATSAGSATKATQDAEGNNIKDTYAKKTDVGEIFTGEIPAGTTVAGIVDSNISEDSIIDIYYSDTSISATEEVGSGELTITLDSALETDVTFKVRVANV